MSGPLFERAKSFPAGIVHGFTTRHGGVSRGACAGLNLGAKWGDAPEAVAENLRRLGSAAGFDPSRLVRVRQVHGRTVVCTDEVEDGSEADALFHLRAHGPGLVGVLTADCVPVLLVHEGGEAVAAIHSGWRGTVASVVTATVESLSHVGIPASELLAAIGPCIERDAFEVGPEVAERFAERFVHEGPRGRPHVDLVAAVWAQLEGAGVHQIERVGGCTHGDPSTYYSYRRDGSGTGQHLAFVGWTG